jgi:hypothetical protein
MLRHDPHTVRCPVWGLQNAPQLTQMCYARGWWAVDTSARTTDHYRIPKSIGDTLYKRQVAFLAYFVQKSDPTESKTATSRFSVLRATRPYVIPPAGSEHSPNLSMGSLCVTTRGAHTTHTEAAPPYRTSKHLPWGYLGYHLFFTR